MKRVFLLLAVLNALHVHAGRYITCQLTGGRLGDNILTLMKAVHLAQKYDLELLLPTFNLLDDFSIASRYACLHTVNPQGKRVYVQSEKDIQETLDENVLFASSLFTQFEGDAWAFSRAFRDHLLELFTPTYQVDLIKPPTDGISVAVHVRKGGGFDRPLYSRQVYNKDDEVNMFERKPPARAYQDLLDPTKFPPDQYYIDQIKRLLDWFPEKKFYVFIFTDDTDPLALCRLYEEHINNNRVTFAARDNAGHDINVIEDLFSMLNFDCLIRAESAYSIVAEILGDHKVVICPDTCHWRGQDLIVGEIIVRTSTTRTIICN